MKKAVIALYFTALGICMVPFVSAQDLSVKKIPLDPNVKTGKLKNGLTYYIRKNAEPKNRAELRLAVKAGSVLETNQQQGLAHFMEHMNFNGTTNFPKNELVNFLQKTGVRFGADLNAYTGFDETVYMLPIPTDSAGLLEKAFRFWKTGHMAHYWILLK
jgi:zinc protease